jgi:protein-disulfide isomerase
MNKTIKSLFSKDKFIRITLPVILVIILAIIGLFSFNSQNKNLSMEEAKEKAEKFVNDFLLQSGNKANIKEITSEYGLYKLKIDITDSVVDSYISKDGKLFFPQALDIDDIRGKANGQDGGTNTNQAPAATVSKKSAKPKVELFVMSYCPYGTQIEKGMLPVVEALGDKIDFSLKFCDYAMHGEKEIVENTNQYCIQQEQPDKFASYLSCFLESSDSASCLDKVGVDKKKLSSCYEKTDKKFSIIQNFKDKKGYKGSYPGYDVFKDDNEKYNVGGSPTLIINGEEISSARDAASLLATICSAFEEQPDACKASLSSATPAPGFGTGTTAGGSAANCE